MYGILHTNYFRWYVYDDYLFYCFGGFEVCLIKKKIKDIGMNFDFIPMTNEISIGEGIVYRPIKSWHSGTYSGERLLKMPGTIDRSGCLQDYGKCFPPLTCIHRIYWHKDNFENYISAFLSYPLGMGAVNAYFWEIYPTESEDIERFESENKMEIRIIECLTQK